MMNFTEEPMTDSRVLTETDLFRSYWDDGLLDILAGMALLVTGLGWSSRLGAVAVLQIPLWIVLWGPLRRRFVEPRAGFVRFSLARQNRNVHQLRDTVILGIGVFFLVVAAIFVAREESASVLQFLAPGLPASIVAFAAILGGVLTGALRFHIYAVALFAAALTIAFLGGEPAVPLMFGGAMVAGCGAVLLTRFVRDSRDYGEES